MAARSCLHSISHFLEPIRPPRPAQPRSHVPAPAPICRSRTTPDASSSSGEGVLVPDQRVEKKSRRGQRAPRRLITISTSDGRWHGQWNCDYVFSLGELGLADVAEGGQADAEVLVSLTIEKSFNCSTLGLGSLLKEGLPHASLADVAVASHHTPRRLTPHSKSGFCLLAGVIPCSCLKLVAMIHRSSM